MAFRVAGWAARRILSAAAAVAVVVAAGIVIGFVWTGDSVVGDVQASEAADLRRAFTDVRYRMTKQQVRERLGAPRNIERIPPEECWYYQAGEASAYVGVCFRRGRVYRKEGAF